MTVTTNTEQKLSRADTRRLWKKIKKQQDYADSGFLDLGWGHINTKVRPNKYVPHLGKKQIGRGH